MKFLLVFILLIGSVFAKDNLERFVQAYKAKDMSLACSLGRQLYRSNIRDEKILIATGHACAEDDYIDFIGVLQQRLGETPSSRYATVYFSTLLLKKRLISQYMHEDIDLSPYTLPLTDHVLSKVFEAIQSGDFELISQDPKHLRIGDKNDYIDVYVKNKLYINLVKDSKVIQEHRYR
ncbi:MAG: hypothetical protein COA44_12085 [Arcobacter sp.]|nr:MAG: hypothetical protein COA44_12085 [Arcobacter sp.]